VIAVVGWLLAAVFAVLSGLHIYWALGGRRGAAAVVPQRSSSATDQLFTPPLVMTLAVATALAGASVVELCISGVVQLPDVIAGWPRPLAFVIAAAFLLRAIGERRYVGFFKRVRGTTFSRWDDRLFSPLCLGISTGTFALAIR